MSSDGVMPIGKSLNYLIPITSVNRKNTIDFSV